MSDRDLNDLDADLLPLCRKFLAQCQEAGINAFITQTYRSSEDQDADYAKGRTEPGEIVTNAKGGESAHNTTADDGSPAACAFDFAIQTSSGTLDWNAQDPAWQKAIRIGESLGLVSGSEWHSIKDNPHFELLNWKD